MKVLTYIITFFITLPCIKAVWIFSTSENLTDPNIGSGLRLKSESVSRSNFTRGISICGKFNYSRIAGSAQLIQIETPGALMWSFMGYQETFMQFGYINWVVKEVPQNNFRLWSTNRWHQICWSFDRNSSYLMFVKVLLILVY